MNSLGREIRVTDHFVERYYERVFKTNAPNIQDATSSDKKMFIYKVIEDIKTRISERDRNNFLKLFNVNNVKLPFLNKLIVMKNATMITILN